MSDVVIVENGGANTASLLFALERLGCNATLTSDPEVIRAAGHVILPGVGAAADAMSRLRARALDRLLPELRQPVLGICLGMQLLYESSDEGTTACLGAIPGRVRRMTASNTHPVPHMGWNQLSPRQSTPLLEGIAADEFAYFVHSYAVPVGPETLASTDYGGEFSAVVAHDNFFGVQFHPERSAATGARVLRNFLGMQA